MTATGYVHWFKVPIIGMPGFPTCELPVTEDGRLADEQGEPLPIEQRTRLCGKETVWCAGKPSFLPRAFPCDGGRDGR